MSGAGLLWLKREIKLGFALTAAPLLAGCYVYRPVTAVDPQPGTRLAVELNDQGRAALVTSVGPEVDRVEGSLISSADGEYVIRVYEVFGLKGTRTTWSGETISVRGEYVKLIREKRLSGGRTVGLVGGVVGAMVGLVAGASLVGLGGGGDGKGGGAPGDGQ
jgi:hypothetical protein